MLIVIGIIGVVAALTIPTLMTKISSRRNAVQFKKDLSVLNQALKMNYAKYDFDISSTDENATWEHILLNNTNASLNDNSNYFSNIGDANNIGLSTQTDGRIIENYNSNSLFGDYGSPFAFKQFIFPDGSIFMFDMAANGCTLPQDYTLRDAILKTADFDDEFPLTYCIGFIDVNGIKGPNREGTCKGTKVSADIMMDCELDTIADIFPVVFYDSTVAPVSNASRKVMLSTK